MKSRLFLFALVIFGSTFARAEDASLLNGEIKSIKVVSNSGQNLDYEVTVQTGKKTVKTLGLCHSGLRGLVEAAYVSNSNVRFYVQNSPFGGDCISGVYASRNYITE